MKREAAAVSVALHLAGIAGLLSLPASRAASEVALEERVRVSARLIAPPPALTQSAPNRARPAREVSVENLLARRSSIPPPPAQTPIAPAPKPSAPTPPPPAAARPEPRAPPLPEPESPEEPPKLAFETPAAAPARRPADPAIVRQPGETPSIRLPSSSLADVIEEVARNRRGSGVTIGDSGLPDAPGGIFETRTVTPPTAASSSVEMLSDPRGVDFKPYLIRVLTAVRRNWRAVFPESARLGSRGKVVILFSINRAGRVPKLVIAEASGMDALDRAAVAGVSASDPFPPLPGEFDGEEVRLQLNFFYNMRQ
ncbi:MAG: TonB family protein [Bryobacteraceae bacterium]|nr:TonB family protein [Bryobacteraceae bacterium]